MAGSRGYNNYRHQADVFNLYHILKSRGFNTKKIITLAYNDIVNHEMNPRKGIVYNNASHINVYPGSKAIDYQEKEATAENFLRVLKGDKKNGRALETTDKDDIFIYFNDHGAPGLLCVPANNGPLLYADQLDKVLKEMYEQKKFRRIFFVIEACYSGSVARNISVPNVFVLSAAGPSQSSYSADWDDEVDAFLSNEFTKHFVKFILEQPKAKIIDAVNYVSQNVLRSHVTAYGDFRLTSEPLSTFLLDAKPVEIAETEESNSDLESNGEYTKKAFITFLERKYKHSEGDEKEKIGKILANEKLRRKKSSDTFRRIANGFDIDGYSGFDNDESYDNILYDCYRTAVEGFRLFCGEVDEHELPKLRYFVKFCRSSDKQTILEHIRESCPSKLWSEEELYV
ncbi:Clan CD, family C13, asparaginyl endopeptidase-like cysteine peptidase [Histomonas meleagridis]|uniref:Clan CD, family C13, asparaginyl endopeptidase-like cysteine peptidase n=1 Tax=Histomonas meleagridis TaxID=135588 RepID=UPI00355AA791|nr:Clan CD, family C13, asparaginyl endopeptidase-like cysteine peptidase [Histomonas meleagridis]KAH0801604.1 Clan CD, family C13, asparaginyl endopeptidase-like cysteine peptidase [Histomonas meleagridis]